MLKIIFCFFLTMHVLGDFYFQGENQANEKRTSYKHLLVHSFIYLLVYAVGVLPFYSLTLLISAVSLAFLHFAFDSIKFLFMKKAKCIIQDTVMYVVSQIVHLVCIATAALALVYMQYEVNLLPPLKEMLAYAVNDSSGIFKWVSLLLLAHKPANITIKLLINKFRPSDDSMSSMDDRQSAGAFIGTLERTVILILISIGQYAAIGLVLTAKSVARYNKISENKQFAEYYLAGTLLSTLYAIITYHVIT